MFCDCAHSCFDPDRLQHSDDLGSYCLINSQGSKRDTRISAWIGPDSITIITADITVCAVIADLEPASAMAAPYQTDKQSLSLAQRAAHHHAFPVGIVSDQLLIPFIVGPG
jgi:hypothetical protein